MPPGARQSVQSGRGPLLIVIFTVALLLLGAVAAYLIYLSFKPSPLKTATITVDKQITQPVEEVQGAPPQSNELSRKAKKALVNWLQVKSQGLAANVQNWGDKRFVQAMESSAVADKAMEGQQSEVAINRYSEATRLLEGLMAEQQILLQDRLERGLEALTQEEAATAHALFEQAIALDPGNEEAQKGLKRAVSLDQVISYYQAGLEAQQTGALQEAKRLLQEAVSLDADYQPAAELLVQVEEQLKRRAFNNHLGQALAAMDRGELETADGALQKAAVLYPEDRGLGDATVRLIAARQQAFLDKEQRSAEQLVQAEDWQKALQVYEKVLARIADAGFAVQGKSRTQKRLALDIALEDIIARPHRLQEDAVFLPAKQLLSRARTIEHPGPRLRGQIDKVETLLTQARTKVRVQLVSDEKTSVTVYHVGRLGAFRQSTLYLLPGSYTMVGSRSGYRDVRLQFQVRVGNEQVIDIRCKERI
jgi:tetratricopeptide (TPR) repeat protein